MLRGSDLWWAALLERLRRPGPRLPLHTFTVLPPPQPDEEIDNEARSLDAALDAGLDYPSERHG